MSAATPVFVVGPTASGKSDLALDLAERFDGEVVNADAMQLYRGMDIGTAKPSPADRAAVPHHLIDIRDPLQAYSAAEFAAAHAALVEAVGAYKAATDARETFAAEGPCDDTLTLARLCAVESSAYCAMVAALAALEAP